MFNIVTERFVRMTVADGVRSASLPEVFAALMKNEVTAFPALRPHQRHAWHAFLVQLGAMAMYRAGLAEPPSDAVEWRRIIRALTLDDYSDDEPWQLVVDDITKPAFMQPPASSTEREKDYKSTVTTPDELDMLVTSKNHDLKAAVATQADPDEWLFALVTLQTMSLQNGRGNYPISRIRSAYSGRPAFSLAPPGRTGAHVLRDIKALQKHRRTALANYPMTDGGVNLLWIRPWDGNEKEGISLDQLDPFYIEICRRVRLQTNKKGNLYGVRANSKSRRIEAKNINGRTGDPWTPINKKEGKALNIGPAGFSYKRITTYLTSADWEWPLLLSRSSEDRSSNTPMQLVARSTKNNTNKQGMTEGYHERVIPLRSKTIQVFGRAGGTAELGDIAQQRIEQVGIVQSILRHAITSFATHGDDGRTCTVLRSRPQDNPLRKKVDEWVDKLDEIVDAHFFDGLQDEFEVDDETERKRVRNEWLKNGRDGIVDYARRTLHAAEDSLPCPAIHRYRARVNAEGLFEDRIRGAKGLPFLFDEGQKEN